MSHDIIAVIQFTSIQGKRVNQCVGFASQCKKCELVCKVCSSMLKAWMVERTEFTSANRMNWLVCWEYHWKFPSISILSCSVITPGVLILSYLAPREPKEICYCKRHYLLSISIILWRFVRVFIPYCFEGFPQGTYCLMCDWLCVWMSYWFQVLIYFTSKD